MSDNTDNTEEQAILVFSVREVVSAAVHSPDQSAALLHRFRELFTMQLNPFGAEMIQAEGGVFVASVLVWIKALHCAQAIKDSLNQYNQKQLDHDKKVDFRVVVTCLKEGREGCGTLDDAIQLGLKIQTMIPGGTIAITQSFEKTADQAKIPYSGQGRCSLPGTTQVIFRYLGSLAGGMEHSPDGTLSIDVPPVTEYQEGEELRLPQSEVASFGEEKNREIFDFSGYRKGAVPVGVESKRIEDPELDLDQEVLETRRELDRWKTKKVEQAELSQPEIKRPLKPNAGLDRTTLYLLLAAIAIPALILAYFSFGKKSRAPIPPKKQVQQEVRRELLKAIQEEKKPERSLRERWVNPDFGKVVVIVDPPKATVVLDGKVVGHVTPLTVAKVSTTGHTLRVVRKGYDEYFELFNLKSQKKVIHVKLRRR